MQTKNDRYVTKIYCKTKYVSISLDLEVLNCGLKDIFVQVFRTLKKTDQTLGLPNG